MPKAPRNRLVWVTDTETTGEKPPEAAVCEIAAVPVSANGEIIISQAITSLVNPGHGIPADCRAVHHISDTDVAKAPKIDWLFKHSPFKKMNGALIAAHNAQFDLAFLQPWVKPVGTLCTYRLALHLWPGAPNHKNQTLRYYLLGAEPPKAWLKGLAPHRALYDAICTAFILREMLKLRTLDQLIEMSAAPALLSICNYNKHKGTPWAEVPSDYLRWILRGGDHSPDVTHTARTVLASRSAS